MIRNGGIAPVAVMVMEVVPKHARPAAMHACLLPTTSPLLDLMQGIIKPATAATKRRYADVPWLVPPEHIGPPTLFVR